jgi:hypothetical protein
MVYTEQRGRRVEGGAVRHYLSNNSWDYLWPIMLKGMTEYEKTCAKGEFLEAIFSIHFVVKFETD